MKTIYVVAVLLLCALGCDHPRCGEYYVTSPTALTSAGDVVYLPGYVVNRDAHPWYRGDIAVWSGLNREDAEKEMLRLCRTGGSR